jgi:Fe-S cluster assembly protein SufD
VTVADDARADIVIDHTGQASLAEGIEIRTGARSHVNLSSIQEWQKGSRHLGSQRIEVGRGAELQHNVISLSGSVVRLRMDPDFAGPDGFLNMLGIYFADPGSYMEHRTMVVHNHPSCRSRVIYKGALDGTGARSAWVGNALILPTAPKTDSYELNRNLVLSPGAVANSEPQLEIENGAIVGAGHASSVGRFDDEQLFYLESRGIGVDQARKLVVRGFFADLIGQIGVPGVEKQLMDTIDRRLARGESSDMARILEED